MALGVGFFLLFELFRPRINKTFISKTKKSRASISFLCNLILIIGGLAIALYALKITADGSKMNASDLEILNNWVSLYIALVWVLAGFLLGALIKFIFEAYESSKMEGNMSIQSNDTNDSKVVVPKGKQDKEVEVKIELKIDTADLSKMDIDQLRALSDYLDQIKRINVDSKLGNIAQQINENHDKDVNRAERDRYQANGWVALSFGLTAFAFCVALLTDNTNNKYLWEIIALAIIGIVLAITAYLALAKANSFGRKL